MILRIKHSPTAVGADEYISAASDGSATPKNFAFHPTGEHTADDVERVS
jgi:hypothetical protein